MFTDQFTHSVDSKGRVSLPSDMRDVLMNEYEGSDLVVLRAPGERCLWAFPRDEWARFARNLAKKGIPLRKFSANAAKCRVDGPGRIRLSEGHLTYAGIVKDAVFVGAGAYIEIWDPTNWAPMAEESADDLRDLALDAATMLLGDM
ncbi:MAG: MraZ protein [Myxococcota bacterium]|jgi:MraZ protein